MTLVEARLQNTSQCLERLLGLVSGAQQEVLQFDTLRRIGQAQLIEDFQFGMVFGYFRGIRRCMAIFSGINGEALGLLLIGVLGELTERLRRVSK